jgi:UDP-N-acetylmuramoyl-tripeptide--D-alanyl-D-alanine ligase
MDPVPLEILERWCDGTLLSGNPEQQVSAICSDSRALKPGDLFFALRGERFDGHAFVPEAVRSGALGAVVDSDVGTVPEGFALLRVSDVLGALQKIAGAYRQTLSLKVVAITGSNGKTSTKDLTAAILQERFRCTKTAGNLNNHIGVPLTLLQATSRDEVGVFEIGMNHPGEIAPLAALVRPDVAVITNIGVAHIEYMGSREAIALEKGALAEALFPEGVLVLGAEGDFCDALAARTAARKVFCGSEHGSIRATGLEQDFAGTRFLLHADDRTEPVSLPVPGAHMVSNALLAVGAGLSLGLTLAECAAGLAKLKLTKGRLEQKEIRGIRVLDDTYNANPDSMVAALHTLVEMPCEGRRLAVLGRMGELGAESEQGHRCVGEAAGDLGVDVLIAVGAEAAVTAQAARLRGVKTVLEHSDTEAAIQTLREMAGRGDLVLVKGSRSARMERVVEGLERV